MQTEDGAAAGFGARLRWMIERRLGWTHAEFARQLEVPAPQLSRWLNRAGMLPSERYLERMAELGGVSPAWLRYGVGSAALEEEALALRTTPEEDAAAGDALSAEALFRHFEGLVRRMGGAEVAPEELKLRKEDVVDGLIRLYAAQGVVPDWVYVLKGRVRREEI